MNYQDSRRPPPALKADDGPQIEQLPGQLSASRFNQDVPPPQADLPAENVLEVIDGMRFDALVEAANIAKPSRQADPASGPAARSGEARTDSTAARRRARSRRCW